MSNGGYVVEDAEAREALRVFRGEWTRLVRVQVSEAILARGDALAWEHALRGYDAEEGMVPLPEELP